MIVGAPKAGTTALKYYLGQHPGVCTHSQREMQFFANDERYGRGYEAVYPMYFRPKSQAQVICGKSVAMMYSAEAMARLQRHNPDVHVVVLLRNPVDRAYSEFWYARRRGWEPLSSFEAAIADDGSRFGRDAARRFRCSYLERSSYAPYLEAILRQFAREQVHVILLEDLAADAVGVCQSLLRLFPELDPNVVPSVDRRKNAAALPRSKRVLALTSSRDVAPRLRSVLARILPERIRHSVKDAIQRVNEREVRLPALDPATRLQLNEYFLKRNRALANLLGRDLSHWYQVGLQGAAQRV